MKTILLLAKRELEYYINTIWGYLVLGIVLLIDGILFNAFALTSTPRLSSDVLEDFFYFASGTTMVAGILLAMRLFAEERQTGTLILLESSPISDSQIVLGKFLGSIGFLSIITLLSIYMPILIQVNGKVSWGQISAGYLGLFGLGSITIALGIFGSTLAKSQLFSAMTGVCLLVLMLLGWLLGKVSSPPLDEIFSYIALFDRHFQPFMQGRINTESLIFFFSVTCVLLVLSTRIQQIRRQA